MNRTAFLPTFFQIPGQPGHLLVKALNAHVALNRTGEFFGGLHMSTRARSTRAAALLLSFVGIFLCTGTGGGGCEDAIIDDLFGPGGSGGPMAGGPGSGPGGGGSPPPATAPNISIGADSVDVESGTAVTFTVNITGGTPPYYIYWFLEGDGGWTLGGTSETRVIEGTDGQTRLMYCQVIDATNAQSNQATIGVTIRVTGPDTACDTIAGNWRTVQGFMIFEDLGGGQFFGVYDTGTLTGQLGQGAPGCPDCLMLFGFWLADDGATSGSIEFTFDPDLKSWSGRWSYDPNTHWQADFWDGFRDDCN
jgi:hypothetical protein